MRKLSKEEKREFYEETLQQLKANSQYMISHRLGICYVFSQVAIKWKLRALKEDFQKNKPSFWKFSTWKFRFQKNYRGNDAYWWTMDDEGFDQRLKFLEHLIKKNTD